MTRLLYWDNTARDIVRMNDSQLEVVAHWVQQRYANSLNSHEYGRFFQGGSGNAGSAVDTRRTQRSGSGNNNSSDQGGDGTHSGNGNIGEFIGTGSASSTVNYSVNTTPHSTIGASQAPLYWNGSALQRSTSATLDNELFPLIRTRILSGNELGAYRISTSNPGSGWILKQSNVFQDRIFNNFVQTSWHLYLKTGGVSAPSNNQTTRPLYWDSGNNALRLLEATSHTSAIVNYIFPLFANWAFNNGLRWGVSTSNQGTNKGTFINTQRPNTQNTFFSPDTYTSTPVGTPVTITTYYFHAT